MPTYILKLAAIDAVRLLRAETESAYGQPEFETAIWKEYITEEDFDRSTYALRDVEQFDLVTGVATLAIEPRIERDYWTLSVTVKRPLGPFRHHQENNLVTNELTLDEFERELQSANPKWITVRLTCETAAAERHFDYWLMEMRSRHPTDVQAQ